MGFQKRVRRYKSTEMIGCRDASVVSDSGDGAIDIRDEFIDSRMEVKEELLDESKVHNKLSYLLTHTVFTIMFLLICMTLTSI